MVHILRSYFCHNSKQLLAVHSIAGMGFDLRMFDEGAMRWLSREQHLWPSLVTSV